MKKHVRRLLRYGLPQQKERLRRRLRHYLPQQSDKNCAAALLCLIGSLFFLSVVVFTFMPTSPAGLVSTALGSLSMFGCIFFFIRYHTSIKREKQR